ncbi:MAG: PSD1 and planctomycete cytochrome C domain-containing protein [Pirellulales bacterium]
MFHRLRTLSTTIVFLTLAASVAQAQEVSKIDFAHDVIPILRKHCVKCHSAGTYKGGFSIDTRAKFVESDSIELGKPAHSDLIDRLSSAEKDYQMPPEGDRLSLKEIGTLRLWIKQGAAWEPGFTFKTKTFQPQLALKKVELPPATKDKQHPIDRLLGSYYQQHKVEPTSQISDAGFMRRATLDLVGLLPDPQQLDEFVKSANGNKDEELIDALLTDNQAYTEHWITFWNDLLRNDYVGTGFIDGGRKQISGWLYQSLIDNKPYDQFVQQLIAPTPESEGFIHGIKWRGRVNASQVTEIQFAQNVGQVFLGINLKCASCHDSFIDDWKLEQCYNLAAIVSDRELVIHHCDKPTGDIAKPAFLYPEIGNVDPKADKPTRLKQTAQLLTHEKNGRFSRTIVNRLWQRLLGRGLVEPVDIMSNEPWSEDLLDYLAQYLVDHNYDTKALIRHICTSKAYHQQSMFQESDMNNEAFVFRGPLTKRMTAEQFVDAVWHLTGTTPKKIKAPVKRDETQPVRASLVISDLLMRSLGRPNREQVVTTRPADLTTLQALDLSNGQIFADLLSKGATQAIKQQTDANAATLIDQLYQAALSRSPSEDEHTAATTLLGPKLEADSVSDLYWAILMLPEFQLIR